MFDLRRASSATSAVASVLIQLPIFLFGGFGGPFSAQETLPDAMEDVERRTIWRPLKRRRVQVEGIGSPAPILVGAGPSRGVGDDNLAPLCLGSDDLSVVPQSPITSGPIDVRSPDRVAASGNARAAPSALCRQLQGLQCWYPPEGKVGAVTLLPEDLNSLEEENYVNDSIMNYFIKRVQANLPAALARRLLFLNTFFYKKLTERALGGSSPPSTEEEARDAYERVSKWTKKVDIFETDYIFVPVHGGAHWSLFIICFPRFCRPAAPGASPACTALTCADPESTKRPGETQPAAESQRTIMLHLDPLRDSSHETADIHAALTSWLTLECAQRAAADGERAEASPSAAAESCRAAASTTSGVVDLTDGGDSFVPPVVKIISMPRQANYHDCGLFVLTYIHFFASCPPRSIHLKAQRTAASMPAVECTFTEFPWWESDEPLARRRKVKSAWKQAFLMGGWFPKHNASALRTRIKHDVLVMMIKQAIDTGELDLASPVQHAFDMIEDIDVEIGASQLTYIEPDPLEDPPRSRISVPLDTESD